MHQVYQHTHEPLHTQCTQSLVTRLSTISLLLHLPLLTLPIIHEFADFFSYSFIQQLSTVQWFSLDNNQVPLHVPVSRTLSCHSTSILLHPATILCVFLSIRSHPGGGRDFPHPSRPALGPTQLPIQ
jgi:hypothetical protein